METLPDTQALGQEVVSSETSLEGWKRIPKLLILSRKHFFRNFLRGMETRHGLLRASRDVPSETSLEGWKQKAYQEETGKTPRLPKLP